MKKLRNKARSPLHPFRLLFYLLICSGCAAFSAKHRPLPPLADPEAYFQSINVQAPAFFSATARIKSESPQGKLSAQAVVFAHLSSSLSLRIELYGFLNQLVFLLTTDREAMQIFYPYSNSFYAGTITDNPPAPRLGGRMFLLVASDLLYGLPTLSYCNKTRVVSTQDGPWYKLELISDICGPQHVWIDPINRKIVKYIAHTKSGIPSDEFSFSDFIVIGDFILPKKIDLIFHDTGTRLSIKYHEINVTQRIEEQMFTMQPPAGAKLFTLKELPHGFLIQPH
jgi:hypothetical protein